MQRSKTGAYQGRSVVGQIKRDERKGQAPYKGEWFVVECGKEVRG